MSPRVPAAVRVLAAASVLVLLPWAAVPLSRALRRDAVERQQVELAATAARAAAVLSRFSGLLPPDEATSSGGVVRLLELSGSVVLDARSSDWDEEPVEPIHLPEAADADSPPPFSAAIRLGAAGGGVYALVEVRDPLVVMRGAASASDGDHVEIAVVSADGEWLRFSVDAAADGPVSAWLLRPDGRSVPDNRIEGAWRTAEGGYAVELGLPRTLVGSRLAVAVVNVEDAESRAVAGRLETSGTDEPDAMAAVVAPSTAATALLEDLAGPATRLWLVDAGKHVVGQGGALAAARHPRSAPERWVLRVLGPLAGSLRAPVDEEASAPEPRSQGSAVTRALAGEPDGRWRVTAGTVVLSAAHPVRAGGQVRGAVLAETPAVDPVERSLARWIAAFLAVALVGTALLLGFAARLSYRLRRILSALGSLADDPRTAAAELPEARATDELGDLARGLSDLARRQREHAAYLEQLGRRLSHEMRTPVGVVRTSLDNLRLTGGPTSGLVYLERADEGVRRLSVILSRLGEATRLEQSIAAAERETYDLVPVVRGCVDGHRASSPGREIQLRAPGEVLSVSGSPEMLAQLLDKLVDNALGFARPGTAVEVDVTRYGRAAALSVRNEGPLLPPEMEGRLFDSMVSIRGPGPGDAAPHLGLGLYVVRLVAEFHGGSAAAHDRPDGRGVIVTVNLPLAPEPARA